MQSQVVFVHSFRAKLYVFTHAGLIVCRDPVFRVVKDIIKMVWDQQVDCVHCFAPPHQAECLEPSVTSYVY